MEVTPSLNIIHFLSEYEKFPCLWNKAHPKFKDRLERNRAEEILLRKTRIGDVKTLRKRIRSIRGTYNAEIRKIRRSKTNGANGIVYVPKLSWFNVADNFLNTSGTDLEIDDEEEFDQDFSASSAAQADYSHSKFHEPICATSVQYTDEKHKIRQQVVARYQKKPESPVENSVHTLNEILQHTNNEFVAFGNSVGTQLQNMPLELALQLQADIQALITRTRLSYLQRNPISFHPCSTTTHSLTSTPMHSSASREGSSSDVIHSASDRAMTSNFNPH